MYYKNKLDLDPRTRASFDFDFFFLLYNFNDFFKSIGYLDILISYEPTQTWKETQTPKNL